MNARMHYTGKQLTRFYLQDLVIDIRCARRDGLSDYADKCLAELRSLWASRHRAFIGQYGVPEPTR
jgi:hypothetical protein